MNDNDVLSAFKKHLADINLNEENKTILTKSQIHNFGENMKGVNEFIGAIQTLNVNISKIKDIFLKVQWIDDLLQQEKNINTIELLKSEKQNHIIDINYVLENSKFMGIALFDIELSCCVNGKLFKLNVENPLNFINDNVVEYCNQKEEDLNLVILQISQSLSGDNITTTNKSTNKNLEDFKIF